MDKVYGIRCGRCGATWKCGGTPCSCNPGWHKLVIIEVRGVGHVDG